MIVNPIIESYIVGLVLGAGFAGIATIPLCLHRTLAATLKDSVLSDE